MWQDNYQKWLSDEGIRPEDKEILKGLDEETLKNHFYDELKFGTAGIRGIRELGSARMNIYIIRKVTQGYATYILNHVDDGAARGVAIAYDTRHMSKEFALEAAKVFSGNGIKVYLFDTIRSTPELSFSVRYLNAAGGLVLTASHNPPEYNGYKVYNQKGCQLSTQETRDLVTYINEIKSFKDVQMDEGERIQSVGQELEDAYIEEVEKISLNKLNKELVIAYTPLHGVGLSPVKRLFDNAGVSLHLVEEQLMPDGDFPSVKKPNPEEIEALSLLIEKGKAVDADLLLATDPDADRLGVMVKHHGEFIYITGNQMGALFVDYLMTYKGFDKEKAYLVTSIVTSPFGEAVAGYYGAQTVYTFTGFKNLGRKMDELLADGKEVVFTYEESIGYLPETFIRDKDGISAAYLIAEMAGVLKREGRTLVDRLEEVYRLVGYYEEQQISFVFPGIEGMDTMKSIMAELREVGIGELGEPVRAIDYLEEMIEGEHTDLLYYKMADNSFLGVRPSGTEPKLKLYINVKGDAREDALSRCQGLENHFRERIAKWL